MPWTPPERKAGRALRSLLGEQGWRSAIAEIAEEHGLAPCALEPYARGETIVWRAGEHVIKLTTPECDYQIQAEVSCLSATYGKLGVTTPRVHAHGRIAGWPYVIVERIEGSTLGDVWPALPHAERLRLARDLGALCQKLHALPVDGFPPGWAAFWATMTSDVSARHSAHGGPAELLASIDPFLRRVGPLEVSALVPLHTELTDQHVYVREHAGRAELAGLIDFADARAGGPLYEFGALVEFVFQGELGLLREFLLAYGVAESSLTEDYTELLFAWSLCHRFTNIARILALVPPPAPRSLEELARRLYSVATR